MLTGIDGRSTCPRVQHAAGNRPTNKRKKGRLWQTCLRSWLKQSTDSMMHDVTATSHGARRTRKASNRTYVQIRHANPSPDLTMNYVRQLAATSCRSGRGRACWCHDKGDANEGVTDCARQGIIIIGSGSHTVGPNAEELATVSLHEETPPNKTHKSDNVAGRIDCVANENERLSRSDFLQSRARARTGRRRPLRPSLLPRHLASGGAVAPVEVVQPRGGCNEKGWTIYMT